MAEHIDPSQLSSCTRNANAPPAAIDAHTGPRKSPAPGMKLAGGAIGEAPFSPTLSLDPANVKAIEGYAEHEGYLAPALNAFSVAHVGLTDIAKGRAQAQRNPAWHEYQVVLNVAGFAEKKFDAMTKAFDKAHKDLSAAAKALDDSLSTPLEQQASTGTVNAEIRAHVKSLSNDERMKFINAAIKDGDTKTLTAILGAPAYLTGLSADMQRHVTRQFHEGRSPEVVRRLKATRAAIQMIEQRSGLIFEQVEKSLGCKWAKVKQLREADSEAKKALLMITPDDPTA